MTAKRKNIFPCTVPVVIGTILTMLLTQACERIEPASELVLKTESVAEQGEGNYLLTGRIINVGDAAIEQHGFCWAPSGNPTINDEVSNLGRREEAGTFTSTIAGMPGGVEYFVRAFVTNSLGTTYGKALAFTTPRPDLPEVVTLRVEDITDTEAICHGAVISDGRDPGTERGICWSTSPDPTLEDAHLGTGTGTGEFVIQLSGLNCSNSYYARAYASNSAGVAYGENVFFSTPECTPTEGVFVFSDRAGIWMMNHLGERAPFLGLGSGDLEVFENKIYVHNGHDVTVYDPSGNLLRSITVDSRIDYPYKMVVLPGERMAFLDNTADLVSITNTTGGLVKVISLTGAPADASAQSVNGLVVGKTLVISEDGNKRLVGVDLGTYEWFVFRDFQHLTGWLGDIDYWEGTYFMVQSRNIYAFGEQEGETLLAELPEGNNINIAVLGNFAYVTSNFGNKVYRVNIQNGSYEVISAGLDYPQSLELVR